MRKKSKKSSDEFEDYLKTLDPNLQEAVRTAKAKIDADIEEKGGIVGWVADQAVKQFADTKEGQKAMNELREKFQSLPPATRKMYDLILNIPNKQKSGELLEKFNRSVISGNRTDQISFLEDLSREVPHSKFVWELLEEVYTSEENIESASKCAENIAAIDPNDPYVWQRLGGMYSLQMKFQDSINCFKKALQFQPTSYETIKALSWLYEITDDLPNAIHYLKLYLNNYPGDIESSQRLRELSEGKSSLSEIGKKIKKEESNYCSVCGKSFVGKANFCIHCGSSLKK